MYLSSWFPWRLARQYKGRTRSSYAPKLRRGTRLACEQLEDRTVPSLFTVTNLGDSGYGSLRQAILDANATSGDDTIGFEVTGTINLAGALPDLSTNIDIQSPEANLLTVRRDTGGTYRIFTVASGATVALRGLTISNGNAYPEFEGGGIYNAGTLTVSNSTLSGNAGDSGSGIYNAGTLTLNNSTVNGNYYNSFGGGIYNAGTLTLNSSTVSGNITFFGSGGGINNTGTLTVSNSTLSGNSTYNGGGGIYNTGTLEVSNSTLSGNANYGSGGGGIVNVGGGTATVGDTIIAGNSASSSPDVGGVFSSLGYNLIGIGNGATGFNGVGDQVGTIDSPIIPLLGSLKDNGGPTWTRALLAGSPAIDAGDPAATGDYDQRGPGFARIVNGRIDIGAFEVQTAPPGNTPPVASGDSYSTNEDTALTVAAPGVLGNDSDADGNPLTAVLVSGPAHGTLTLNSNGSFTYTPAANYNGPDSFTYRANDGAADSNLATVSITVIAVNDAPVNTVPRVTQTTAKNTDLIFSFGNGNPISIADVDAGSALIQVTLAVTNGTLTLSSTTGLSFSFSDANGTGSGDGTADTTMTFRGTLADINAALDGLRFTPRKNFPRSATLTITTNDLGNSGIGGALSDTDTVAIAVRTGAGSPLVASAGASGSVFPSERQSLADIRPGFLLRPSRTASIDALFAAFLPDGPAPLWW